MVSERRGLWSNPDFVKLWAAQTISRFGSHVGSAALEFTAILNLRATPPQMGLLSAMGSAPVLLLGLVAGVWVDRVRRRPILVAADVGRALLLGTVIVAALLGQLRIEQLYFAAAFVGVLSVFFGVADQSALPGLVPRAQLVEANSALGASDSVAEIGGPALGGALVQWLTAPIALLLDALSFLASALLVGLIRTPELPPADPNRRQSVAREMVEGARVVLHDRSLRALAISGSGGTFFGSFIGALYSIYLIRELGLTPALVGLSVGIGGGGALLGALLAAPITRRFGIGPALIGCRLVGATIAFSLPLASGTRAMVLLWIMGGQLLGDIPGAIHRINEASLRQALIPHQYLGRANASMDFLIQGAAPIGALVGGVLGQLIGMRPTLYLAVAGILLADAWLLTSPIRRIRHLTAREPAE